MTSLTLVIPAYDEEARIEKTLAAAHDYLTLRGYDFELLVVDDGSRDATRERVARFAEGHAHVRLIALEENRGKGAAVRTGVLASSGDLVLYMDADLATPMAELPRLEQAIARGADVVFGSRGLPGSSLRRSQGLLRENMGKTFNAIVQRTVLSGISDTQCGFKLLRGEVARRIFAMTTVDRFAFDVEVLLIALDLGYRIEEVPVTWFHDPQSRVSPVADAARMLVDILRIRATRRGRRRVP